MLCEPGAALFLASRVEFEAQSELLCRIRFQKLEAQLDEAVTGVDRCFDGTAAVPLNETPHRQAMAILPALAANRR